ncbi:ATP-binding protein [Christensenella tenuis]|uniref:Stage 0 sporulation protein A homolog n=1 Tax=Christensenella tenuis TaxID=2763033 RepID=A0ABR7EE53_9FIRM|nr:ATP-binding protein [Christensenella tenuis]MBC5648056.1 response regulator [Christensenella tenuis]
MTIQTREELEAKLLEQEQELKRNRLDYKKLERRVNRLKNDIHSLNTMYENTIQLRDFDMAEKEKQYAYNHLLLDAFPHILAVLDNDMNYVLGTDRLIMNRMKMSDPKKLKRISVQKILKLIPDQDWVNRVMLQIHNALNNTISSRFSDKIVLPAGEIIHVSTTLSPAMDIDGNVQGIVVMVQDITEMVLAKEAAEAAGRSKSIFLANMSHEIRTPMNAIISIGHILKSSEKDNARKEHINNLLMASETLMNIINDILDFSKIDVNKLEIVSQPYSMIEMLDEVINLIALKATEKDLEFIVQIDPQLPRKLIGNDLRIKQVLINLLSNAIKYTRKGRIFLWVGQYKDKQGIKLAFTIQDTGIGIKKEEMPYLFDAFTQLDVVKNKGIQGTGLGLAISKGIAQKMNGNISVASTYHKGSTFEFTLPQNVDDETPIALVKEPQKKCVLVFGDNISAELLTNTLNQINVQCDRVKTVNELQRQIEEKTYTHMFFWEREYKCHKNKIPDVKAKQVIVRKLFDAPVSEADQSNTIQEPLLISEVVQILNKGKIWKESTRWEDNIFNKIKVQDVSALVVDDIEINCLVTQEILKQYGMCVDTAQSGMEALDLVGNNRYDIIFMDHMMPDMDGIETTIQIRNLGGWNAEVPIIALTANTAEDIKKQFNQEGMNGYMSKPLELKELNNVLHTFLPNNKIVKQK